MRIQSCILALGLAVTGCQAVSSVLVQPHFAIPNSDLLTHPVKQDWTSDRITSAGIFNERKAFFDANQKDAPQPTGRRLQAYPTVGNANWSPGGVPGIQLFSGDWVSGSPAASFFGNQVPTAVQNKVFFLTKGGRFYRVDKTTGNVAGPVTLTNTFERTFVTLSPSCTRAYCLDGTGRLHIIDTINMVEESGSPIAIHGAGGGAGIAPVLDPINSDYTDRNDALYIPTNDGYLTRLWVSTGASTGTFKYTGNTLTLGTDLFNVATTCTPKSPLFSSVKIAAPGIAYNNHFYIGDMDGKVYDVDCKLNDISAYDIGQTNTYVDAIHSAPTLEVWDSVTYPTVPSTYPNTPVTNDPAFLFVNSGRWCNWINLIDDNVSTSQDLWVDDNYNTGAQSDNLLTYNYSDATYDRQKATYVSGGNMDISDSTVLPGSTNFRSSTYISPASDDGVSGSRKKVVSYMRWSYTPSWSGYTITAARLGLKAYVQNTSAQWWQAYSPVITAMATSPYYNGTTSLWTFGNLVNAAGSTQAPVRDSATTGRYTSTLSKGLARYSNDSWYYWDVTNLFASTPVPLTGTSSGTAYNFGVALEQPTASVMYPGGLSGTYTAQRFYTTPTDKAPKLEVTWTKYTHNPKNISIYTSPVVDSVSHRVYVLSCNNIFGLVLDYQDTSKFEDTVYDPNSKTGTKYTVYCRTNEGDITKAGNGGTYNAKNNFILNMSTPLLSYDGSSIYCLNMYPTGLSGGQPTTWDVALSKINTSNMWTVNNSDPLYTNAGWPEVTGIAAQSVNWMPNSQMQLPNVCSNYLVLDPYSGYPSTGGGIYYGLANGKVYFYQP